MNLQEWIGNRGNQEEKIIITDNIRNVNVLIRNINQTRTPVCNLKVKGIKEIAKEILIVAAAEQGNFLKIETISNETGAFILQSIIEKEPYRFSFVPEECMCYQTAREILNNINLIRQNRLTDLFIKDSSGKTGQLWQLKDTYEQTLESAGLYDVTRLIREATLLLQAKRATGCKSTCARLFFDNINYLEETFMSSFAPDADRIIYSNIKPQSTKWLFFKGYGVFNEVEYAISEIIKKKIPFGEVTLIYTKPEYETYIAGSCAQQNIPVCFVSGRSAGGFNYIRILQTVLTWAENGYSYTELKHLFFNPIVRIKGEDKTEHSCMREFITGINSGIGWGLERYRNFFGRRQTSGSGNTARESESYAEFLNVLERLCELFSSFENDAKTSNLNLSEMFRQLVSFADDITPSRNLEKKSIRTTLGKEINGLKFRNPATSVSEAVQILKEDIDRIQVVETEKPDAVQAVKYRNMFQILERPNVFAVGLSDKQFRQALTESPVLSDEEREIYFDLSNGNAILARSRQASRQENFVKTLESLHTGTISVGYCGFDTIKQELSSPSALYLNLLESRHYKSDDIKAVGYERIVEEDIQVNEKTVWPDANSTGMLQAATDAVITVTMSPTALDTVFECPLKYHYKREEKIPEEDYQEMVEDAWLNAADKGNFIHRVLQVYVERYIKSQPTVDPDLSMPGFTSVFTEVLNEFNNKCPKLSQELANIEINHIRDSVIAYLRALHQEFSKPGYVWHVEECEKEFDPDIDPGKVVETKLDYDNGQRSIIIRFKGKIDRIDSYTDANGVKHYRLIDYKTGNKNSFKDYKLKKTTQHHVYAKYAKADGEIDEFIYVFPLEVDGNPQIKTNAFEDSCLGSEQTDERKSVLEEVFFKKEYKRAEQKDIDNVCKYCNYSDICSRNIF